MSQTILVVDDEQPLADLVELYLKKEGYSVLKYYNGSDALTAIEKNTIDLAILDIMLPDIDGFSICQSIREHYTFPVIMLTAKNQDSDKINGLMIGADDYITKPFNPLELIARVKAQLRRTSSYNQPAKAEDAPLSRLDFNGLLIDRETHECFLYDQPIALTPTEFDILWLLAENRGRVISSEELFESIWGEKFLDSNNTVMVHIRRIRDKMHEPSRNPKFIKTVWGVGYKIDK